MESAISFQGQNFTSTNSQFTLQLNGFQPEGGDPYKFSEQVYHSPQRSINFFENQMAQKTMSMMPIDQNQGQPMWVIAINGLLRHF